MNIEEIRAQLWARVYADCLERKVIWFEAKDQANQALYWLDKRDDKKVEGQ